MVLKEAQNRQSEQRYHIVCIGVSTPLPSLKTPPPPFQTPPKTPPPLSPPAPPPPLNLQAVQPLPHF